MAGKDQPAAGQKRQCFDEGERSIEFSEEISFVCLAKTKFSSICLSNDC